MMTTTTTTTKTGKAEKTSEAAWVVGEVATGRRVPLLPLPRLLIVLESLGAQLSPVSPHDGIHLVATDLGEAPGDVGAIAMALLRKVDSTKLRYQTKARLDSRDEPKAAAPVMSVEPKDLTTFEERARLSIARERFLTELELAIADLSRLPVMRDMLIFVRQRVREEARVDRDTDARANLADSWSTEAIYADLREWVLTEVAPATLHKRLGRLWDHIGAHPTLSRAFKEYLEARVEVWRAGMREGDGYARPLGWRTG